MAECLKMRWRREVYFKIELRNGFFFSLELMLSDFHLMLPEVFLGFGFLIHQVLDFEKLGSIDCSPLKVGLVQPLLDLSLLSFVENLLVSLNSLHFSEETLNFLVIFPLLLLSLVLVECSSFLYHSAKVA